MRYLLKNYRYCTMHCERNSGLMVNALDSGLSGPSSCIGRIIVLCSWTRHFTLTVPLSTQAYKWVPANCQGNLDVAGWQNGKFYHPQSKVIF